MRNLHVICYRLSFALLILILFSCDTDERIEDLLSEDELVGNDNSFQKNSTSSNSQFITKNGQQYFAGFGFDPNTETPRDLAIETSDILQSTNISEPLIKSITIIKTQKELSSWVKRNRYRREAYEFTLENGGDIDLYNNRIVFAENTVTIAARISIQRFRHITSGLPKLVPEAFEMLNQGKVQEFTNRYGSMYVDSQLLGGELYYFYTFQDNSFSSLGQTEYEQQIRASIEGLFGVNNGATVTPADQQQITESLLSTGYFSTVSGFEPGEIRSIEDFDAESQRFLNYITNNPDRAATVALELTRYFNVNSVGQPQLNRAFFNNAECYIDASRWLLEIDDLTYVSENSKDPFLVTRAENAIDQVRIIATEASQCQNGTSVSPGPNEYADIKNAYREELINGPKYEKILEAGEELVSVSGHTLRLQNNGVLVLYDPQDRYIWFNNGPNTAAFLAFDRDGNFALFDSQDEIIWTTNTATVANSSWEFTANGNLQIVSPSDDILWSTFGKGAANGTSIVLRKGDELVADNNVRVALRNDGVLVMYDAAGNILWYNSGPNTGEMLTMSTNGQLVLKDNNGIIIWSPVNSPPGSYWQFDQSNGDLIVRGPDDALLWSVYNKNN